MMMMINSKEKKQFCSCCFSSLLLGNWDGDVDGSGRGKKELFCRVF